MDGLWVSELFQDLHLLFAELEPHVDHLSLLGIEEGYAEVKCLVIKLGGALGKDSTVGIEAAELDVGELLVPDALDPGGLEEIKPRYPVVLGNVDHVVLEEDVLLEVESGRSRLLADSASPPALRNLPDMLDIALPAPSLVLVELVGLQKDSVTQPTNMLFGGA